MKDMGHPEVAHVFGAKRLLGRLFFLGAGGAEAVLANDLGEGRHAIEAVIGAAVGDIVGGDAGEPICLDGLPLGEDHAIAVLHGLVRATGGQYVANGP